MSGDDLPGDISGGLAPMSTPLGDMFMFTVDNNDLTLEEKRFLVDWVIRPALRTVPGVADVNALGGFVKTYQVAPRIATPWLQLGVANTALIDALSRLTTGTTGPAASTRARKRMLVRVSGAITDPGPI